MKPTKFYSVRVTQLIIMSKTRRNPEIQLGPPKKSDTEPVIFSEVLEKNRHTDTRPFAGSQAYSGLSEILAHSADRRGPSRKVQVSI